MTFRLKTGLNPVISGKSPSIFRSYSVFYVMLSLTCTDKSTNSNDRSLKMIYSFFSCHCRPLYACFSSSVWQLQIICLQDSLLMKQSRTLKRYSVITYNCGECTIKEEVLKKNTSSIIMVYFSLWYTSPSVATVPQPLPFLQRLWSFSWKPYSSSSVVMSSCYPEKRLIEV